MGSANILLLGRTGEGKSQFINYLFGYDIAPTGSGEPVTKDFEPYPLKIKKDFIIWIYDSKGLEVHEFQEESAKILDYAHKKCLSRNITDWFHSIFYCINLDRTRLEPSEEKFIRELSNLCNQPIHIIITHCPNPLLPDAQDMKNKIRSDLGNTVRVFFVNSKAERKITGNETPLYGKGRFFQDIFDLLWDYSIERIAREYAIELRKGLFHVIASMEEECEEEANEIQLPSKKITLPPKDASVEEIVAFFKKYESADSDDHSFFSMKQSSQKIENYVDDLNSIYNEKINSFLSFFNSYVNAFSQKQNFKYKPYTFFYDALLDESIEEFFHFYARKMKKLQMEKGPKVLLSNIVNKINGRKKYQEIYKDMVLNFCEIMRKRVPSQAKIEKEVTTMLNQAKKRIPYVRPMRKIGPNEKCPCGSGEKYKKCCMGKGIFD